MRPSPLESSGSRQLDGDRRQSANHSSLLTASARRRTREEGTSTYLPDRMQRSRSIESWIEISSQPSSSSLASINNERVPRPLIPPSSVSPAPPPRATSTTGSSQDEYEESSSESDPILSSSNEDLAQDPSPPPLEDQDDNDDEEDNRTALAPRPHHQVFTPQPNAFSHPPSTTSNSTRHHSDSYFPTPSSAPTSHIRTRPYLQRERDRALTSSQHHDAALRASLTTLLSCAAAVRPKHSTSPPTDKSCHQDLNPRPSLTRPSIHPTSLRLIPSSSLPQNTTTTSSPRQASNQPKRRSPSPKSRHPKKARPSSSPSRQVIPRSYDDYIISPYLSSWAISAGMMLMFSAIGFSAGFWWGREVGRCEAASGSDFGGNGSCAAEATAGMGSGWRLGGRVVRA